MGTIGGPNIVKDNLILHLDSNNTKSFPGEPTTNLVTNPTNEVIGTTSEFVQYADIAPIFNTYGTGVTYSLSLDLKSKVAGSMNVYMQNGSSTKYSFVSQAVNVSTEYQRFYFNSLSARISNSADTAATLAFYGTYGSGRIPSIKNVQIEIKPYATPFVNGTRGNTVATNGGWYDLSNNSNNGDLTNMGFDSTGMLFNGSSTYINCGNNTSLQLSNTITMCAWIYPHTITALGNIIAKNGNSGFRFRISSNNLWWYVSGNACIGGYVPLNTWTYCVVTGNASGLNCYINSTLVASNSTAYTPTAPTIDNLYIGCYAPNSETFDGNISNIQIYNKALSQSEISQNFNAIKSKYGL